MYAIVLSTRAKKMLRKYRKSGSFPHGKFKIALAYLRSGEILPPAFLDHQLKGLLAIFRELHLAGDMLVQYKRNDALRVVTIIKIGTHAEVFGG